MTKIALAVDVEHGTLQEIIAIGDSVLKMGKPFSARNKLPTGCWKHLS
jgi:hypothetical protein